MRLTDCQPKASQVDQGTHPKPDCVAMPWLVPLMFLNDKTYLHARVSSHTNYQAPEDCQWFGRLASGSSEIPIATCNGFGSDEDGC
jgi:hypothetical protein